jgi:hypothetical protein
MNPDDQKPVMGAAPTNTDPTMTPPTAGPAQPSQMPQSPVGPTPPVDGQPAAPDFGQQPASGPTPVDNTPGVTPVNPTENSGAYGQGNMQSENPQPLTPSTPNKAIDRRKTGLILLAVVIIALAVVAWLMTQAFSG